MILKRWEQLPIEMQNDEVRRYYEILREKKISLLLKRVFDIVVSTVMILVLMPVFLVLAVIIKVDSKGPVFYRQIRVTQYNQKFRIFKFRTMEQGADKGAKVTSRGDLRITRIGRVLRKYRLDEISQLFNIFRGEMTFVSTRPEVPQYTKYYSNEMLATLLLPAGVTSLASIYFKDEAELLDSAADIEKVYIEKILPAKMHYNLKAIENFNLWNDIKVILMTVLAVLGVNYKKEHSIETGGFVEDKK